MKFTDDVLKKIMGKCVRITCVDMKSYIGTVDDFIYPDDNHNGKAGLSVLQEWQSETSPINANI